MENHITLKMKSYNNDKQEIDIKFVETNHDPRDNSSSIEILDVIVGNDSIMALVDYFDLHDRIISMIEKQIDKNMD